MFVCIRFATMLGRHSANAPPNCSIQNKKIRNFEYYKEKKESLKAKKVRCDFKIEFKSLTSSSLVKSTRHESQIFQNHVIFANA